MGEELPDGFLDSKDERSDTISLISAHSRSKVTPLFDAEETFQAIETAISAAENTIHLLYWDLQTDLKVQTGDLRHKGFDTWTDLLMDAVKRGVAVRVLLNDFDPDVSRNFHFDTWKSYDRLVREAKQRELTQGLRIKKFQVICWMHEAELRPDDMKLRAAIALERGAIIKELNDIAKNDGLEEALKIVDRMPRIWEIIELDQPSKTFSLKAEGFRDIHVASNHQKICIIDRKVAFCGGIDAKQDVLDNRKHEKNPFRHDIHCVVQGPPVVDVERNFVGLWNYEVPRFKQFVRDVNKHALNKELLMTDVDPIDDFVYRLPIGSEFGSAQAQVLRTITGPILRPPKPAVFRDDVERSYEKLIGSASKYVYIENQYLRWPKVGDCLIDRFKEKKMLQVIIVLPSAPEEAFAGTLDEITLHGMYLQYKLLKRLESEMGTNVGIFTLAAKKSASSVQSDNPAIFDSPSVYVHSKVCIVDDAFSIIGSANLNGRSMRVDDELNIGWLHPAGVKSFRIRLWEELLGIPRSTLLGMPTSEFLRTWHATALGNVALSPEHRKGFVFPYDIEASKGKQSSLIPDIYA